MEEQHNIVGNAMYAVTSGLHAFATVLHPILGALNAMRQGVVTRKMAQEPAIQPWLQPATL